LIADFVLLSYIGQAAPESPFIEIGQIASVYYFAFFLVLVPALGILEQNLIRKL
jgi:ubiquinol-cytochrome c reductase cytochrome b subunit